MPEPARRYAVFLAALAALSQCTCAGPGAAPAKVASAVPVAVASAGARGPAVRERMVIKTAELEVITDDPGDGFCKAQRMARQMGGYTLDANREDERQRLTLRVPEARFEEALLRLGKLGKVDRRQISGKDVTGEVVDLEIRLKNAEKMRERYLQLLARAENVTAALEVQKELERVTADIESMKGRLELLRNQVSLATIHLTLDKPTRPGPLGWVFYGLYRGVKWLFIWD
jgi:hypothetical protein